MTTGIKAVDTFLDVTEENYREPPTDVTVVVGKETFECHKSVLDSWSQYFRAVFTSPMSEQKDSKVRIEEGDYVTAESFQLIQTYMYSGKIEIAEENLIGILRTAHYLQMFKIVKLCKEFIHENIAIALSRDIVVHLVEMDFPDLCDVQSSARNHLTHHLYEYIENKEFVDLSRILLQLILEEDEVGAWDEDQIFMAVLEWLLKDGDRYQHGDSLLSKVRLGSVSAAKLGLVRQHIGLLPHLTTVEPIITDIVFSSVLEETDQIPYKEKYPEMYRKRIYRKGKIVAKEDLERMVLVCLQPGRGPYYWDKGGWVPGKLGLEDCISNIALGAQTLYKINRSNFLMSRSMQSQKWTLLSRLPEFPTEQNPFGLSTHYLASLGSYVYILSPGLSLQYDIKNKMWCVFDNKLTQWDCISQAAACYSTTDPKNQGVIVIAGLENCGYDDLSPAILIGNPPNCWDELTVKWENCTEFMRRTQGHVGIEGCSDIINLIVSEEGNSMLALTNGPAVYSLSLSDMLANDQGTLPQWQEEPITEVCDVSIVTWRKKHYSIFRNILIPNPTKSELPAVEDLRYNPRFVGNGDMPGDLEDWDEATLMVVPKGLIGIV